MQRRRVAWTVLAVVAVVLSGCRDDARPDGSVRGDGDATHEVTRPEDLRGVVLAGSSFVTVNEQWWSDRSEPALIASDDGTKWAALPPLPEDMSAIGLGAADGRLVVTALGCDGDDGTDLCSSDGSEALEYAEGPLRAWIASSDLESYRRVDLPDGTVVSAESLAASSGAVAAVVDSTTGPVAIWNDGRVESVPEAAGASSYDVIGDVIAVLDGAATTSGVPTIGRLTSVGLLSLDGGGDRRIEVLGEVPGTYPFVTPDAAIWIDGTTEHVLDFATGRRSTATLPPEVAALTSATTSSLGAGGSVDAEGRLFIWALPLLNQAPPPGVARRMPDGTWSMISDIALGSDDRIVFGDEAWVVTRDGDIVRLDD